MQEMKRQGAEGQYDGQTDPAPWQKVQISRIDDSNVAPSSLRMQGVDVFSARWLQDLNAMAYMLVFHIIL